MGDKVLVPSPQVLTPVGNQAAIDCSVSADKDGVIATFSRPEGGFLRLKMPIEQARSLAMAFRQAANDVERYGRSLETVKETKGGRGGNKQRKKVR